MAGFASGFGSAFADSFNTSRRISAEKTQDMFKLKYADYISRRDQTEKEEREAQNQIKAAKAAVARAGAPAEMWGEAYKILRDGGDLKYLDSWLTENEFSIEPTSVAKGDPNAPATPQDSLTEQASSSVDAQMAESGMQPPADKGIFGNLKDKLMPSAGVMDSNIPSSEPQMSRRETRVTNDIAQASGVSPEQVNKTLGPRPQPSYGIPDVSYKAKPKTEAVDLTAATNAETAQRNLVIEEMGGDPKRIEMARKIRDGMLTIDALQASNTARAQGFIEPNQGALMVDGKFVGYVDKGPGDTWINRDTGQPVDNPQLVKPFDRAVQEDLTNIVKETAKDSQLYIETASNFSTALRDAKSLSEIVKANPGVMGAKGWVAKLADDTVRNTLGTISLLKTQAASDQISPAGVAQAQEAEAYLEQKYQEFASSGVGDNLQKMALARALVEAKAVRAAYQAAASVGQSGQGVAAREFDRFYNSILGPNDQAWQKQTADFLTGEYAKLKQMETSLNKFNTFTRAFEQKHKFPSPIQPAEPLDSFLEATDPEALKTLEMFKTHQDSINPEVPNANQMNTGFDIPEGYRPTGTFTKDGKPLYIGPDGKKGTFN